MAKPVVGGEQGVFGGVLVDDLCEIRAGNGVRAGCRLGLRRRDILLVPLNMARQERIVFMLLKTRQQSLQGRLDIADRSDRHGMTPANMRRILVDLKDRGLVRIELRPGEIGTEQQQRVAVEHSVIAGGPANDARHADIVWVVMFDEVLAARGMSHRRLQSRRRGDDFVMRTRAARAGIDRDRFAPIEDGRDRVEVGVARANERARRMNGIGQFVTRGGVGDVRRHDQHGDASACQGRLAGRDRFAARLLRRQNHLAEDATALEHVFEIDFLDRFKSDILPYDLGCDHDDGGAVAIGFVEAVDEMETARAATSRAGRQAAGQLRLGLGRKGAGFLMPHMDPIDLAAIDGVGDPVQRVADDPVAVLNPGGLQRLDQYIRYSFAHLSNSSATINGIDRRPAESGL
jgi:hypothetical protein